MLEGLLEMLSPLPELAEDEGEAGHLASPGPLALVRTLGLRPRSHGARP